jgi:hypothetical protein
LSGWSQVNTALFFHSQPYRDAFVNQFNHLRYFAWTQERDKQLMKTPPKGALTPPADVALPPAGKEEGAGAQESADEIHDGSQGQSEKGALANPFAGLQTVAQCVAIYGKTSPHMTLAGCHPVGIRSRDTDLR